MRRVLARHLDERREVMLVARTAQLARGYALYLAEDGRLRDVRVTSLGALPDERPADVAVLTGMAPSWARWVYRAGVALQVDILAYVPESSPDPGEVRFSEADVVRATVERMMRASQWAHPDRKARAWAALTGERVPEQGPVIPPSASDFVPVRTLEPPDVPPGLWDGSRWLAPIEPTSTIAPGAFANDGGRDPDAPVAAVRVRFKDGRWALLEEQGTVTRFRPASGESDEGSPVSGLRPGDQIVLLDGDCHKNLLSKVLEVAGDIPELAVAASWVALVLGGSSWFKHHGITGPTRPSARHFVREAAPFRRRPYVFG